MTPELRSRRRTGHVVEPLDRFNASRRFMSPRSACQTRGRNCSCGLQATEHSFDAGAHIDRQLVVGLADKAHFIARQWRKAAEQLRTGFCEEIFDRY